MYYHRVDSHLAISCRRKTPLPALSFGECDESLSQYLNRESQGCRLLQNYLKLIIGDAAALP